MKVFGEVPDFVKTFGFCSIHILRYLKIGLANPFSGLSGSHPLSATISLSVFLMESLFACEWLISAGLVICGSCPSCPTDFGLLYQLGWMSLKFLFLKYSSLTASYNPCRCSLLRCERLGGFVFKHSSAVPNRSETDVVGEQRLLALMNASASVDLGCSLLSAIGLLGLGLVCWVVVAVLATEKFLLILT